MEEKDELTLLLEKIQNDIKQQDEERKLRKARKAELWKNLQELTHNNYFSKEEEFEAIDEIRKIIFKLERII